ncbi:MAG: hypothetical protein WDW38_010485 [Sanguina aurantia]
MQVAKIMDRMSKDGRVKVTWFYRPEEAVGGRKGFHGLQELFGYHWDCLAIKDERELDAVHHFVCPPCIKSAASSAARHTREQAAPPQHNGDSSPPTLLFNPTHYHSTMGHDASFTQHGL